MQFGNLMRFWRKRKNMTLRTLSEKTGLSISFLSDVEHSRRKPPKGDGVDKIVDALDVEHNRKTMLLLAEQDREPIVSKLKKRIEFLEERVEDYRKWGTRWADRCIVSEKSWKKEVKDLNRALRKWVKRFRKSKESIEKVFMLRGVDYPRIRILGVFSSFEKAYEQIDGAKLINGSYVLQTPGDYDWYYIDELEINKVGKVLG